MDPISHKNECDRVYKKTGISFFDILYLGILSF